MNKSFKVVFNKARGALMVVNEVTSSVQAKGTKTVVAAAVATLMAGGAMANTVTPANITGAMGEVVVGAEQSVVVTGEKISAVTGKIEYGTTTPKATLAKEDTFADDAKVTLKGGALTVSAQDKAGEVLAAPGVEKLASLTVKEGSVVNVVALNVAKVAPKAQGEAAPVKQNATLTVTGDLAVVENATFKFDHIGTGDDHAVAGLVSNGNVTLGKIDASKGDKLVTIVVTKDTDAKLGAEAAGGAALAVAETNVVKLDNVALDNAGKLNVVGSKITLTNVDFTKNAGDVTFTGASTVAGNIVNAGKTVYDGKFDVAADASFTTGKVVMNAAATETAYDTLFKGAVEVAAKADPKKAGVFNAESLTMEGANNFTVNGVANVTGDVAVKNGTFGVTGEANVVGTMTVTESGQATLGGKSNIGTLVVTDATNVVTSTGKTTVGSLKIGTATAKVASGLTVSEGTFVAKEVALVGHADHKSTMTVSGGNTDLGNVAVDANGVLAVSGGVNKFGTLTVKKDGDATFAATAENVIGTLDAQKAVTLKGKTKVDAMKVAAKTTVAFDDAQGTLTLGTLETTGDASKLSVANGTLKTSWNTLGIVAADKAADTKVATNIALNEGKTVNVEVTEGQAVTLTQFTNVKAKLNAATLKLKDVAITNDKGGNLAQKDLTTVDNYAGASVVDFETKATTSDQFTVATTVGVINLVKSGETVAEEFAIRGNNQLTVRGNGKEFVTGDVPSKKLQFNETHFGEKDAAVNGGVYAGVLNFAWTNTIDAGNWTFGDIAGTENNPSIVVSGGNLTILGQEAEVARAGENAEGKYKALTIGLDTIPGAKAEDKPTDNFFTGTVTVSGGHFVALGNYEAEATAAQAQAQAEAGKAKANVIYVGEQTVVNTAPTFAQTGEANSVVVNLATVAQDANFDKTQGILVAKSGTVTNTDVVELNGLNAAVVTTDKAGNSTINLGNALEGFAVDFNNVFYKNGTVAEGLVNVVVDEEELFDMNDMGFHTGAAVEQGVLTFTAPSNVIAATIYNNWGDWNELYVKQLAEAAVAAGLTAEGVTAEKVLAELAKGDKADVESLLATGKSLKDALTFEAQFDNAFWGKLVNEENTATNLAVAGGAFNAALDVNDQVTSALNRRTSLANLNAPRTVGVTPWVDVFGTFNENEAYEADVYGAVLGMDYTAACGGVLGFAFNVGQADSNSANNDVKVDNSADFYGFGIYAAQTFGDFNVKADFGYTKLKNELSANTTFFGRVAEDLDSDVLTFGLGAEYLVKFGDLNVVPHAGLRMSRLSMDDSLYGATYEDMTVYQMPMGVAFSGTFDMNGWKLAPMVDLAVVPAFGDKDAVASYFGGATEKTRVVDTNPVQATLGLEAQNGAWTFGVNYGLTAGGDDRMNNSLNANVRYTF